MIKEITKIADVINAFHDGEMLLEKKEGNHLVLKIDCEYLAKAINPDFSFFWMKIHNCHFMEFHPWSTLEELSKTIWTSPREIFEMELEIISAEVEGNRVEVSCYQYNANIDVKGGKLLLDCQSIELFDQEWNRLEYLQLREITNDYWKKI